MPILDTLKVAGIDAYGLKLRGTWENLKRPAISAHIGKATHFLFICSAKSVSATWFAFVAGYAIGREFNVALFRADPFWDVPRYLANLPVIDSLDELYAFYDAEKEEWISVEARRRARASILEMGVSFHADSLAECVKDGDFHAVSLFLEAGFQPDSRDKHGVPLLVLAVRHKHKGLVELLLGRGADIDLPAEDRGYTALMDAAANGNLEILEFLLGRGASTALVSKDGQTALIIAVGRNDAAMAKILIEAGADPDVADKLGLSARKYAKLFHNKDMIPLFEEAPSAG